MFFTDKPNLVKAIRIILGSSYHEIDLADSNVKAHFNKQAPKHIHL